MRRYDGDGRAATPRCVSRFVICSRRRRSISSASTGWSGRRRGGSRPRRSGWTIPNVGPSWALLGTGHIADLVEELVEDLAHVIDVLVVGQSQVDDRASNHGSCCSSPGCSVRHDVERTVDARTIVIRKISASTVPATRFAVVCSSTVSPTSYWFSADEEPRACRTIVCARTQRDAGDPRGGEQSEFTPIGEDHQDHHAPDDDLERAQQQVGDRRPAPAPARLSLGPLGSSRRARAVGRNAARSGSR